MLRRTIGGHFRGTRGRIATTLALGAVAAASALTLLTGTALAHHDQVTEHADCQGWLSKADYIGGTADRKVVVDVVVDGEVISETFFFDNGAGHLGHQDGWHLFERSGTGPIVTSGTITMYQKVNGAYTSVVDTDTLGLDFDDTECYPTSTPTKTATNTPTSTNTPNPTHTPTSTHTPKATDTPVPSSTSTPRVTSTRTPHSSTKTPAPTSTHTVAPTRTPISVVGGIATTPTPPRGMVLPGAGSSGVQNPFTRNIAVIVFAGAMLGIVFVTFGVDRRTSQ